MRTLSVLILASSSLLAQSGDYQGLVKDYESARVDADEFLPRFQKEAEQNAALIALQELGLAKEDDKGHVVISEDMGPPPARRKKRSKGKKKTVKSSTKSKPSRMARK